MSSLAGLVTVLYNSNEVLEGFFRSLSRQSCRRYRLYLVDNSPNPGTDALLKQLMQAYPLPYAEHIKSPANIGVAAGNNAGIRRALADNCTQVLLLNNDIEIEQDDLLENMLRQAEAGEAIIVPRILYFDSRRIWMAGGHIDNWRALGVHEGYGQPDGPAYHTAKYIGYAPTCFMMLSREVLERTGWMDEQYFAYYDDVDFVMRAARAGYRVWYEPSLVILHKVSSSSGGEESPFYVYYSHRNKVYFVRKNRKGLFRWIPLLYLFVSRVAFWIRYDALRRKKMIQGIRDGFRLPVS